MRSCWQGGGIAGLTTALRLVDAGILVADQILGPDHAWSALYDPGRRARSTAGRMAACRR
jgi:glycine/D-amino acid oxidase-like deaminating enzyme